MTRILVTIGTVLFASAAHAHGFDERPRGHGGASFERGFFVNPFSLLAGELNAGYERAVDGRTSIMLAGRAGQMQGTDSAGEPFVMSTLGGEVQPHFYLARRAPHGPYFAPFVGAGSASIETAGVAYARSYVTVGSTVGWSWVWGRFNLKLGVGADYEYGPRLLRDASGERVETIGTPTLAGDLKMGFLF